LCSGVIEPIKELVFMRPTTRGLMLGVIAASTVATLTACGGGGFSSNGTAASTAGSTGGSTAGSSSTGSPTAAPTSTAKAALKILIASSGDAETKAVKDAAAAWATKSGNTATVTPAQNMQQQLGQAFAANKPPDVFYLDAASVADYASIGALWPYGDQTTGAKDFYPSLVKSFTYNGKFYCAPKDFSTLALEINTTMWAKAGLTTADIPTTWAQLTAVSQKIKAKGMLPLVLGPTRDRVDAFIYQGGGSLLGANGQVTADNPANVAGLTYVKSLFTAGLAKYSSQLDTGWAGEAFGKGKAVMTMEGNWIKGAMQSDYPTIKYTIAPLPAGTKAATLEFTQCWGIPANSPNHAQALDFVNAMTSGTQELAFAKAFGVMPSLQSVKAAYTSEFPNDKAFLGGAASGVGPINVAKSTQVLADYDTQLTKLASTDPKSILARLQKNLAPLVKS
jgi:multiple sugar transport system substrate-binding protein